MEEKSEIRVGGEVRLDTVPVGSVSALRYKNLDELMRVALEAAKKPRKGVSLWNTALLKKPIDSAVKIYQDANVVHPLFHALKALEADEIEAEKNRLAYDEVKRLNVRAGDFEAASADLLDRLESKKNGTRSLG